MKIIKILILFLITLNSWGAIKHIPSQLTVGDDVNPDDSVAFSVESSTQASVPCPIMTEVERDAIASPLVGSCIFNSDTSQTNVYKAGWWQITGGVQVMPDLLDVTISATQNYDMLVFDLASGKWYNTATAMMTHLSADNIVTGSSVIDASAIFAVDTTTKGSIPCPKMTEVQRDAVVSPTNGLCIYNTTTNKLNTYNTSKSLWLAAGDAGTTFDINQVGHGRGTGLNFIPVYHNGTTWEDAQADTASHLATHAIINVYDNDNFVIASSGRFEITAHGLATGYHYTSAGAAGTLTVVEPTLSNPIILVEDANILHILPWRASTATGVVEDAHNTVTPTGTTASVNFNLGRSATIDLGSATGDVTLTLNNPAIGDQQWLKFVQGATARQVVLPDNVYWEGGNHMLLSTREDAEDIVHFRYDGNNYYAFYGHDFYAPFSSVYSVLFDGIDAYADCGNPVNLRFEHSDPFSFTFWAKRGRTGATELLVGNRDSGGSQQGIIVLFASNALYVNIKEATGGSLREQSTVTYAPGDGWKHFAVTYDGSADAAGLKFYESGNLLTTTIVSNTLSGASTIVSGKDFQMGANDGANIPFQGNLDNVAVWNTELTISQVQGSYNAGSVYDESKHSQAANLISFWHMGDNDTFPTLTDKKGTNDCTLTNALSTDIVLDAP